ncbi:MAG: nicotinate (nicotinamide) nucleotide adenylyltransferase [Bacteroidales bacterium]|jgi:nicotinate-nucleotide adenylyltransferase|nr:nicotinate (nicotinamide) nucleotide adenylyltransferase [Bacteroidales bacterium]MDD4214732.1 nicotinate (nicotinamide) nucleotide adenylyltransferase [Bacteroidales bacterium]
MEKRRPKNKEIISAKNIGLYFGSFNPIHTGHLAIAKYLLKNSGLDEIWFVVSPQSPFKKESSLLDDDFRFNMVQLAIKNFKRMRACNIEFTLPKPSYTIDTLSALQERFLKNIFSLIIGSDNLELFHKWKDYNKIIDNYKIFVYPRRGFDGGKLKTHSSVCMINAPLYDISSTWIREIIKSGKDVKGYMPERVLSYIEKMGFYK